MEGITILYDYDGDEEAWDKAVAEFVAAVDADREIAGKFHYRVNKAREGSRRVHWGWWDEPATVKTLQSRDYFQTFSRKLKSMAGDSLTAVPVTGHAGTTG